MSDITVNFSGRDFATEYERLIALLRQQLPEYTDLNYSDPGMVLLALVARETDQLNYFIDRVAQEGFLQTAVFRQSLIELGRLVDYLPTLASPASTVLRLTRKTGVLSAIYIPKHTVFSKRDGVTYLTIEDITIPTSGQYADVNAIQGIINSQLLLSSSFDTESWCGRPKYNLGVNTVASQMELYHTEDTDIYWTEVDSFWQSTSSDFHYLLELNGDDDSVYLVLGDGTSGSSLDTINANTLYVQYITTLGPDGNCGSGLITVVPDNFSEYITCTNTTIATGGAYSESIDSLRVTIPAVTRAQRRGVTKEDYPALLEHLPGILHVQVKDRNDSLNWPHLYIILYVVPDGGGDMTPYLYESIIGSCITWGHLGTWENRYITLNATRSTVDIVGRIGINANVSEARVLSEADTAIRALLLPENQDINGTLVFDDLHSAVMGISGVSWIEFDSPSGDITSDVGCINTIGTLTLTIQD